MKKDSETLDVVGIGIGPANLSLAALAHPLHDLAVRFYDRASELAWHPGLLFPESSIQTSYLKDLVTPVDPTSRHSFLAFLVAHRRFYSFVTASFPRVSRTEFGQYLAWVARSLPSLRFGSPVREVTMQDDLWVVATRKATVRARDLVLGTGLRPHVPECARSFVGPTLHHAIEVGVHQTVTTGRRVAVIGGGQSGAELVYHLLSDPSALPAQLTWVSRRDGFPPMDDSPFANELFTPAYSDHFFGLAAAEQRSSLRHQALASDGVSLSLLQDIYRQLYTLQHVRGRRLTKLLPRHQLSGVSRNGSCWELELLSDDGSRRGEQADVVFLATGHRYAVPECLAPLQHRLDRDGEQLRVRADFSVVWDGPPHRRIFLQNGARAQRGVADPNLSLLAWRSATILNSLAGRQVYDCQAPPSIIDWAETQRPPQDVTAPVVRALG
jgi:lysine N6-hydroxylase